ncbi:MAG: hypothetical protein HY888_01795 [Deltaproteobacteria bacterium]|nr:hypothetical protein [Deltaproteobacteria bacterium]
MLSSSSLTINWQRPDIEEERWEYFSHPAKQEWYGSHEVSWEQIVSNFESGRLIPYPRSMLLEDVQVALSYHSYSDYKRYLCKAKRGYRISYNRMEDQLQCVGTLNLKAPIILCGGRERLLFSGYRRLCLAWNYGMIPYVWLVDVAKTDQI